MTHKRALSHAAANYYRRFNQPGLLKLLAAADRLVCMYAGILNSGSCVLCNFRYRARFREREHSVMFPRGPQFTPRHAFHINLMARICIESIYPRNLRPYTRTHTQTSFYDAYSALHLAAKHQVFCAWLRDRESRAAVLRAYFVVSAAWGWGC